MSGHADRFAVVLDTNVLVGTLTRNMLLSLAEDGRLRVRWSRTTGYQRLAESRSRRAGYSCGIRGIHFAEATLAGLKPAKAALFEPRETGQSHV